MDLKELLRQPLVQARPADFGWPRWWYGWVRPDERVKWDALMDRHHYLGFKRAGRGPRVRSGTERSDGWRWRLAVPAGPSTLVRPRARPNWWRMAQPGDPRPAPSIWSCHQRPGPFRVIGPSRGAPCPGTPHVLDDEPPYAGGGCNLDVGQGGMVPRRWPELVDPAQAGGLTMYAAASRPAWAPPRAPVQLDGAYTRHRTGKPETAGYCDPSAAPSSSCEHLRHSSQIRVCADCWQMAPVGD